MDMMEVWEPTFEELNEIYQKYFTLKNVGVTIDNKFGLISLVCFLTKQARVKKPDATCLQVLEKVNAPTAEDPFSACGNPDFIRGLAIICEDYMQTKGDFMTFGMKSSKEMVAKIREILGEELPF